MAGYPLPCLCPCRVQSRSEVSSTLRHFASTNHNTTNIVLIDEALAAIDSLRPGEEAVYLKIATQYSVNPETLRRHALGIQEAREVKNINQSKLSPQEEQTLIDYINNLTERRLQPTRRQIQLYASQIAEQTVSKA